VGTAAPTVVLKAADNTVLTGRTVAWSSSNAAVATVNATTGLVTAVAVGSATITATSEGIAGTMAVSVVPATESNRYASIWANQPTATIGTPYTPSLTYSQNAAGGDNSVTRTGVGTYNVVLGRLGKAGVSVNRENIFVTAYGSAGEYCRVGNWNDTNTGDVIVAVACFDVTGALANSYFDLAFVGSSVLTGQYGFMWNSSATGNAVGSSGYAFSTGTGTVGSTRTAVGSYTTTLGFTTQNKSAALVSTYVENAACSVDFWSAASGAVSTRCTALNGSAPVDARSTVMLMEGGRAGKRWGFAWANLPTATAGTPYTPQALYQNQSNGQSVSVTRNSTGDYTVVFPGLGATIFNGTMLVSAYSNGSVPIGSCQVSSWTSLSGNVAANVRCWNLTTGTLADQFFVIVAIE
jgi:hypothetical protein